MPITATVILTPVIGPPPTVCIAAPATHLGAHHAVVLLAIFKGPVEPLVGFVALIVVVAALIAGWHLLEWAGTVCR